MQSAKQVPSHKYMRDMDICTIIKTASSPQTLKREKDMQSEKQLPRPKAS